VDLVVDLTVVLIAALAGGFLAQRLGQPLIVGYIVAGVAIGPFTGGLAVVNLHDIEQLAEIGVALLLFSLGLEVSFRELAPVRAVALLGGAIQILLTIALGFALALWLGWAWTAALWFGSLIAISSTMVALKTIQSQGRLGTLSSRVMLGILVVQDLAVVPLMIILPELEHTGDGAFRVVTATLRSLALLGGIVLVSTRVVPRLMTAVAKWNSRELFLLTTTGVALGIGYATWFFGLSLAIGAFIAGLVINESEYAHQALSDVMPLRDLFGMLFFVSVGLLLEPGLLWANLDVLILAIVVILVGKGAILAAVVRLFGYRRVVPLAVGLTLFQVGEFAFVLARAGRAAGAIPDDLYALALNAAVATMACTPAISGLTSVIYRRVTAGNPSEPPQTINMPPGGMTEHVVVCGAGRVGRTIADALAHQGLPCVMIELDDARVQQARVAGLPIIYGDATQPVVLEAAGAGHARAILVTIPAFVDVRAIVAAVRRLGRAVPIVARAEDADAVRALNAMGVDEVTSPEYEAAIEMTTQALVHLDVPAHEILHAASVIRRERYGAETAAPAGEGRVRMPTSGDISRQLAVTWITLPPASPFDGRTLGDLRVRTAFGASVVGLIHQGVLQANPDSRARLTAGDLVAVLGTREQIGRFEEAASGRGVEPQASSVTAP
jgi:CPA2 family monovalent cation:H+ antiporter-2